MLDEVKASLHQRANGTAHPPRRAVRPFLISDLFRANEDAEAFLAASLKQVLADGVSAIEIEAAAIDSADQWSHSRTKLFAKHG